MKLNTRSRLVSRAELSWESVAFALLVALFAPGRSLAVDPSPDGLLAWNFEGIANAWGGHYNVFTREPSWARTYLAPHSDGSSPGYSLRVTVHRELEGFCGVWMDFYPGSAVPRKYLDASSYRFLSFQVKGESGGENFEFQIVDDTRGGEDPMGRRPLSAYLPQGITTDWQEVRIPLQDFQSVNLRRLVRLVFHFNTRGDYRFYLDNIGFESTESTILVASQPKTVDISEDPSDKAHRAMWVWKRENLFGPERKEERKRFFEFCSKNGIQEIYLALELDHRESEGVHHFELEDPDLYRDFIARAHKEGLKVAGLAGTPEWAMRENHAQALAALGAALAFNRSVPPSARLDGVHYDVEPYLLVGYSDSLFRPRILRDFLEMVSLCQALASGETGLRFSVDVPAWFYPKRPLERRKLMVPFRGREKPIGEHLTDLLDSVTIMDYVNQADGTGGIIARGVPALQYAASKGKRIVVGLETFVEPESTVHFVYGLRAEEFGRRLAQNELRTKLYFADFRMVVFSDEINFYIGLTQPREMTDEVRSAFEGALISLARQMSASSEPERFPIESILQESRAAIANEPDWSRFETFALRDPRSRRPISGFRAVSRMNPRITFYGLGRKVFEEESDSAAEWLGRYPSFGGLAIHFYDSFLNLVEGE